MRHLFISIIVITALAAMALGLHQLFKLPFMPPEDQEPQEPVVIYDPTQLTFIDPECEQAGAQINQATESVQTCQTDQDCHLIDYGCRFLSLNQPNLIIFKTHIQKRNDACELKTIAMCPSKAAAEASCINNRCVAVDIIHLNHEIQSTMDHIKKAAKPGHP